MSNIIPIGPAIPEPILVATFPAYFQQLRKDRYGDYILTMGVAKADKDTAWMLTDHDGMMLELTVKVVPRIKPVEIPVQTVDDAGSEWATE